MELSLSFMWLIFLIAEPKTDDPKSGRGSRADIAPEHYVIEEETPRDMVNGRQTLESYCSWCQMTNWIRLLIDFSF